MLSIPMIKLCGNSIYNTWVSYSIPPIKVRHDYFKNSFFLSAITEWNKLDLNIRNSASLNTFKKKLRNFTQPCANSIFDIHNPLGIKLLTRLRLGLSHLHEHKFRHCFQNTLNPLWESGKDIELDKSSLRKLETLMTAFYLKVKHD